MISFLVLDFAKEKETRALLQSIKIHTKVPHKIVYQDNGSGMDYPWQLYKEGLVDVLISKKNGGGGGTGQTDLFRFCDTEYAFFVQNDQLLIQDITEDTLAQFIDILQRGFHCIDLNGDQSGRGVWTDRGHFINVKLFNSLAPFPNGGPGLDNIPWNEEYLQKKFAEKNYHIAHIKELFFANAGKWSIREAGDGLYKHRCDTKQLWVLKKPTYITDVYPPFDPILEWPKVLDGDWVDGDIPLKWKEHSFKCFPDD